MALKWDEEPALNISQQDFIKKDRIPESFICETITCISKAGKIPKAGKIQTDLKYLRPLMLLNSIYKFFSQIISERIRSTLNFLIHPDQTGFVQGRYIGENTRMIYDILHHCKTNNKQGLLMVVDYSKAFDTMEWDFISKCLRLFNFGDNLINMVMLIRKNSFSKIEQKKISLII